MKNIKKVGIVLTAIVLMLAVAIFAAVASDDMFTGTVYRLGIYVNDLEKAASIDDRDSILTEIEEYLFASPVNPEEEGAAELNDKIKAEKISLVKDAITEIDANEDPMKKSSFLQIASKWFETIPFTDEEMESDDYRIIKATILNTAIDVASSIYNDIDATKFDSEVEKDIATEGVKLKRLRTFILSNTFDEESPAYIDMLNNFTLMWDDYVNDMRLRYVELTKMAPLTEYGIGRGMAPYTFENNQKRPGISNASKNSPTGEPRSVTSYTEVEANGNSYMTLRWPAQGDTNINAYVTPSYSTGNFGAVIEFDITTFGQFINSSINFGDRRSSSDIAEYGGNTTATFFGIHANGNIKAKARVENEDGTVSYVADTVIFDNVISPGQWTRVSCVVDRARPEEVQVYVDYCYVATIDCGLSGSAPSNMRIGNVNNKSGEFSIDNFTCQLGTWFRNDNLLTDIEMAEGAVGLLSYYTDYIFNDDIAIPDRIKAYENLSTKILNYASFNEETGVYTVLSSYQDDATVVDIVDRVNTFDPDEIITAYKALNLAKLQTLGEQLKALGRGPDKASARASKIEEINKFVSSNAAYIEEGEAYNTVLSYVGIATAEVEMDNNIKDFIALVEAFKSTSTVSIMKAKYQGATTALASIDVSLKDDPLYTSFLEAYNYYLTAEDIIAAQLSTKNSSTIITFMNYLAENYPHESSWKLTFIEGDNLTPEEEANNATYKLLADYMAKIRRLVKEGYDERVIGIDGAIKQFNIINEYYYDLLQAEYAAVYSEKLAEFETSDSYIVRQGVIAYLERFKAQNDVNLTHELIAPLETKLNVFKGELDYSEDTYAELLRQNTIYFVNYVKRFDTAITYSEKKALYDSAAIYYYQMNASGDDEVKEAIATYDRMTAELAVVEDACVNFKNALAVMNITEIEDNYYASLVECMVNMEYIDESIEGMPEAIEEYEEKLAEYNEKILNANKEIVEIGESLGSLRANCGLSAIISVIIERLFGF